MHRFGVVHSLQDIVVLNSPGHSFLNLEQTGTGLGHKPVWTHTKARRERQRWGDGGELGGKHTQTDTRLSAKRDIQKKKHTRQTQHCCICCMCLQLKEASVTDMKC